MGAKVLAYQKQWVGRTATDEFSQPIDILQKGKNARFSSQEKNLGLETPFYTLHCWSIQVGPALFEYA